MRLLLLGIGYVIAFAVAVTGLASLLNGLFGWRLSVEGTVAPADVGAATMLIGFSLNLTMLLQAFSGGRVQNFLRRNRLAILPYALLACALTAAPVAIAYSPGKTSSEAHAALIGDLPGFFEDKANINGLTSSQRQMLFGEAIRRGRAKIARLLAPHLPDLRGDDHSNYASLVMHAADAELLQVLIDLDADFSNRAELTNDGLLAQLIGGAGTESHQISCIALMRKHRLLIVNDANKFGTTPLMIAAVRGSARVAAELLKHGAEVNARDDAGGTAVLKACERSFVYPDSREEGKLAALRVLKAKGADMRAVNAAGQNCIRLAEQSGYNKIKAFMKIH